MLIPDTGNDGIVPAVCPPLPGGLFLCLKTASNCQAIPRGKGSIMGVWRYCLMRLWSNGIYQNGRWAILPAFPGPWYMRSGADHARGLTQWSNWLRGWGLRWETWWRVSIYDMVAQNSEHRNGRMERPIFFTPPPAGRNCWRSDTTGIPAHRTAASPRDCAVPRRPDSGSLHNSRIDSAWTGICNLWSYNLEPPCPGIASARAAWPSRLGWRTR